MNNNENNINERGIGDYYNLITTKKNENQDIKNIKSVRINSKVIILL